MTSLRGVLLVLGLSLILASCGASTAQPPSSVPVKIHVSLQEVTVAAGLPIPVTVVVTNATSKVIVLHACVSEWLQVGLSGHRFHYRTTSGLVGCPSGVSLKPGAHSYPVEVSTTYQECSQVGAGNETSPPCIGTAKNQVPPLPPGNYIVKVFAQMNPSLVIYNEMLVSLTRT